MKKCRGFTLVELSIVLIIIGLLSGGILAAQSMISTVRTHRAVEQLQSYNILIEQFKIRYNTFPGDSTNFYPGANNNGILEDAHGNSGTNAEFSGEVAHVWTSLETAGMISTASNSNKNISFAKLDITKLEPAAASQFSSEINGTFKTTGNIINAPRYLGTGDDEIGVLITGIRGSKGSFLIADFSKVTPDNKTLTLAEGGVPKIQLERLEKKSLTIDPASLDTEARSGDPLAENDDEITTLCGNGRCEPYEMCDQDCNENNNSTPEYGPPVTVCGDGLCQGNEISDCPQDCDTGNDDNTNPATCGNDACDPGDEMECAQECWDGGYNDDDNAHCPSGRYWNSDQNECVCKEHHIPTNETCTLDCSNGTHPEGDTCVSDGPDDSGGPKCGNQICDADEPMNCPEDCPGDGGDQSGIICGDGTCGPGETCPRDCGCPSGQYIDNDGNCQPNQCQGAYEVADGNGGCQCEQGYVRGEDGNCTHECSRMFLDYMLATACSETGGTYDTCQDPHCTCPADKDLVNDRCEPKDKCAAEGGGTVWNEGMQDCVCPDTGQPPASGETCDNGNDDEIPECTGGAYWDESLQSCQCPNNYEWDYQFQRCKEVCQLPGQYYDETSQTCVCQSNKVVPPGGSECTCPDNTEWSDTYFRCLDTCPGDQVRDQWDGCACPNPETQEWVPSVETCMDKCTGGMTRNDLNTNCACPTDQEWVDALQYCQTICEGVRDEWGNCIPCGANEYRNPLSRQCECIESFNRCPATNQCVPFPNCNSRTQRYDPATCGCRPR